MYGKYHGIRVLHPAVYWCNMMYVTGGNLVFDWDSSILFDIL